MEIRHIAVSADGHRAALGAFERRVEIWDLSAGSRVSTFETILDFGGERLAVNRDASIVVAAAWAREGIAGYKAENGKLLWQRRDLKQAQYITTSPRSDVIYAGFETGPGYALDSRTGATLSRQRGVRRVIESPYQELVFLDGSHPQVSSADFREKICPIERTDFAFLSAAFSPTQIAISETGGAVRCITLDGGRTAWTFKPRAGVHCLHLTYSSVEDAFFGILWPYRNGGQKELVRFLEDGSSNMISALGEPAETTFAQEAGVLITSDRRLIGVTSGTVRSSLATPQSSTLQ